jgi:hypothetical protein
MGVSDDIVSQSKFFIDGPMGSFQLLRVKSADVNDDRDAEIVTTVGVDEGAGIRYKPGGGSITLEVFREQGKPEVDWRRAKDLKWRFAFTIQDNGGQREQFFCAVAKAERKDDDQGSHMDTIKLIWTRRRALPPKPV